MLKLAALALSLGCSSFAFAAGHNEVRLEARLALLNQTKANEKYSVETATSGGATTKSTETTKTDGFDNATAYPLLGVTAFNDGLVLGTSLIGGVNILALSTIVGSEVSKTLEAGMMTEASYTNDKEEKKTEADAGGSTEETTHDATRDLGIGPYLRITIPSGASKIEILPVLKYLRHQEDSSRYGVDYALKTGFGLTVEPSLVVNMNKNVQYFGAIDLGYRVYTSGKKVDTSGSTTTTSKLKKDTETTLSVTPLGLRLIL